MRTIKQIATQPQMPGIVAVATDGSLWWSDFDGDSCVPSMWFRLPDLPQEVDDADK